MKKKGFSKSQKTKKSAPESSLGSRLVQTLLLGGCFAAGATAVLCFSLYFLSPPSGNAGQSLENLSNQTQEESTAPPETELSSEAEKTAPSDPDPSAAASSTAPSSYEQEASSGTADAQTDIPMLAYSDEKGDISQIGELEEDDFTDEDYLVMLDTAMGAMLYYNQGDSRWGDHLYGGVDPIRGYGCGPTVAAMLVNAFTDQAITPDEMADWCAENRCHAPQSGSYHSIFNKTLPAFGLQVESAAGADYETAIELLKSGHVLVALMGKGEFTNGGHFIIITNIRESGAVGIADCNSLTNTKMEWDLNQVLSELSRARDSGAPLWAVSYPPKEAAENE